MADRGMNARMGRGMNAVTTVIVIAVVVSLVALGLWVVFDSTVGLKPVVRQTYTWAPAGTTYALTGYANNPPSVGEDYHLYVNFTTPACPAGDFCTSALKGNVTSNGPFVMEIGCNACSVYNARQQPIQGGQSWLTRLAIPTSGSCINATTGSNACSYSLASSTGLEPSGLNPSTTYTFAFFANVPGIVVTVTAAIQGS